MTGIELLVGPALAKAAGTGAARVAGWGAGVVLEKRRRRKIRSLMISKAREPQMTAIAALSNVEMDLLVDFCHSLEMENFAISLSQAYLVEGSGKSADKYLNSIKQEFRESLKIWMGAAIDELVEKAIYDSIVECVQLQVAPLLGRGKLSASIEAEIVTTAGSLAAASVRNAELLKGLEGLSDIRLFETDLKVQVAGLMGTMKLPHAGTTKQVPYGNLFVEPNVLVDDDSTETVGRRRRGVNVDHLLRKANRVVLLGDPGGGKSTLSRKFAYDVAADQLPELEGRVPFFVELRDYASSVRGRSKQTLIEYLEGLCKAPYNNPAPNGAIEYLLLNNRAVLILDGLDELLDVSLRRDVVEAVEGFARRFPTCPMLVTSRRVGYFEAALSDSLFMKAELGQFSKRQVRAYVKKWFNLDESIEAERQGQLTLSFMADSLFVSDLRVNPLMLSLMCGIYASENYIPRNRPDVYEKCALLLFERWDKQRGIVAELPFDAHVQSALRALALHIFRKESSIATGVTAVAEKLDEGMGRVELIQFLTDYLREKRFDNDEDSESAAIEFLDFCKGRAWVLTDIGSETYGFTHRTFLEYFAASQLVRLYPSAQLLYGQLRDGVRAGGAEVVAQLALQILGRNVEDGADDFLELVVADAHGSDSSDLNAISFAARALNFVVPRPQILKDICAHAVRFYMEPPSDDADEGSDLIVDLFMCSQENASRVAVAIRDSLLLAFSKDDVKERILMLAFLPVDRFTDPHEGLANWATENSKIYGKTLSKNRDKFYWIGVIEYELGKISLAQLIAVHGIRSLYEFKIDGRGDIPPFVFRFLRSASPDGCFEGLVGKISRSRADSIARELVEQLPNLRQPWITRKKDYRASGSALMRLRPESRRWIGARILLGLPLAEFREEISGMNFGMAFSELIKARESGVASSSLKEDLERIFKDSPAAHALVENWIGSEVHTMSKVRAGGGSRKAPQIGSDLKSLDALSP